MSRSPKISTGQAAEIFEEALSLRRMYCPDSAFFKASEFWRYVCDESEDWTIKTYRAEGIEDYQRRAGVVAFGEKVTLIVDDELLRSADKGSMFANFKLAHEAGHLILDHHQDKARVLNFRIYEGEYGKTIKPPTNDEYEAHLAAVFFQCGTALFNFKGEPLELARKAYSEVSYVQKAIRFVNLDAFQRHLNSPKPRYPRVIL